MQAMLRVGHAARRYGNAPMREPHPLTLRVKRRGLCWRNVMSLGTILLIILVLLLIGAIPSWSHSRNWGYGPSGGLGLIVVVVLVLLLMGRI